MNYEDAKLIAAVLKTARAEASQESMLLVGDLTIHGTEIVAREFARVLPAHVERFSREWFLHACGVLRIDWDAPDA